MEILLNRRYKKENYTIGLLSIDGEWICNTLEDADRGLEDEMELWMIKNKKIPNRTAIPTGRYEIDMSTVSPRFSQKAFYMQVCQGKVPRILNVKGYDGVLIHCGNEHTHTSGCIIVGKNTQVGKVTESQETFKKIYDLMKKAHDKGEKIYLTIV